MSHRIISSLKLLSLSLLIGLTTSAVFAWTGPTAAPTGGNTPAPLNVSSASQSKSGSLRLGGVRTSLSSYINFASSADLTTKGAPFNALALAINGSVGANQYCDENGENCIDPSNLGAGGGTCTAAAGSVYDSGVIDLSFGDNLINHNLGTMDTVVYVEYTMSSSNSGTPYTWIQGKNHSQITGAYGYWYDKTANTIKINRSSAGGGDSEKARIIMWKKSAIGAGCGGGSSGIGTPDYDSGWVDFETQHVQTLTHNLGTVETFVSMEEKGDTDAVIAHNVPITLKAGQPNGSYQNYGPKWFNKTTSTIDVTVPNGYENEGARYVRIRMWKTN